MKEISYEQLIKEIPSRKLIIFEQMSSDYINPNSIANKISQANNHLTCSQYVKSWCSKYLDLDYFENVNQFNDNLTILKILDLNIPDKYPLFTPGVFLNMGAGFQTLFLMFEYLDKCSQDTCYIENYGSHLHPCLFHHLANIIVSKLKEKQLVITSTVLDSLDDFKRYYEQNEYLYIQQNHQKYYLSSL